MVLSKLRLDVFLVLRPAPAWIWWGLLLAYKIRRVKVKYWLLLEKVGRTILGWESRLVAMVLVWLMAAQPAYAQIFTSGVFSVNSSGAATYSFPIQAPPGVAGMEPKLTLVYNSQAGGGLIGEGWDLAGLSSIARCPQTLAQDGIRGSVNNDINDRYCLDGQRLMGVGAAYGVDQAEYRTEQDGFSRIISNAENGATKGPGSFIVKTKSGLTMEYGRTEDSRIEAQGAIDANGHGVVAVWALSKVIDNKGNYYTVSYVEDSAGGQYYPARIDYYFNASSTNSSASSNAVIFEYENSPNVLDKYHSGSLSRSAVRLKVIRTFSASNSVRNIFISYQANDALHWRSILSKIQVCTEGGECNPAISFTLPTALANGWGVGSQFILPDYLSGDGVANNGTQLIDLNGDGLPDFVQARWINGATQYRNVWLNTGNGWVSAPQFILPDYLAGDGVANNGTLLIDLNGDGLPDFVQARWINGSLQYRNAWLNTGSGWVSAPQFVLPDYLAVDTISNDGTQLIDLNGDGLPDFVQSRWVNGSTQFRNVWLNTGNGWASAPQFILPDYLAVDGVSNDGTQLIDLNGDGLPDFVQARWVNGSKQFRNVWLNTGNGWVSAPQFILPDYLAGDGVANNGTQLIDLNGDGLPDFVQARWINGVTQYRNVWLNTGNGWVSAPQFILPDYLSGDGVANNGTQLIDVNGDGLPDFVQARWINGTTQLRNVWLNTGNGWVSAPQFILPDYLAGDGVVNNGTQLIDVNGDGLPDFVQARWINGVTQLRNIWLNSASHSLMDSFSNGITAGGASYLFLPQSLSKQYTSNFISKYPRNSISAPIPVVGASIMPDGSAGQRKVTYSYGNLIMEVGTGRGSLGFQWFQSKDVSTGLVSRTCYRQDWPYVGMVDKVIKATSDVGLPACEQISVASLTASGSNLLGVSLNKYKFTATDKTGATLSCADPDTSTPKCSAGAIKAGSRYQTYGFDSLEQSRDWDGTSFIALPATHTTQTQDSWGNTTNVVVETLNADGVTASGYSKTTTNTFAPADTSNWFLGRLTKSSVKTTAP